MIKASVIGATGFSGVELVRLLAEHPEVEIKFLTSQTYKDMNIADVYPHLYEKVEHKLTELNLKELVEESDVIFTALPHGLSAEIVSEAYKKGKKIIDLGADFRLKSAEIYKKWYKGEHKAKELLSEAVYALPEVRRDKIKKSSIIANPGCYPTSVLLALYPVLKKGIVKTDDIIVDSKSGVSGAGRKTDVSFLYSSCNESIAAYKVGSHRHTPEIKQELGIMSESEVNVLFTPHLTPMTRGILSTIYVNLKDELSDEDVRKIYEETYKNEQFVKVLKPGFWPKTKWAAGTNNCYINFTVNTDNKKLIVVSAIDNLIKGASGQAVQNMNIIFGLDEKTGLADTAVYP